MLTPAKVNIIEMYQTLSDSLSETEAFRFRSRDMSGESEGVSPAGQVEDPPPVIPARDPARDPAGRAVAAPRGRFSPKNTPRSTSRDLHRLKASVGACEVCGWADPMGATDVLHAHHIVPLAVGGAAGAENCAVLCPNHHALAHRAWQIRRKAWTGPTTKAGLIGGLRRYESPTMRMAHHAALIESLRASA